MAACAGAAALCLGATGVVYRLESFEPMTEQRLKAQVERSTERAIRRQESNMAQRLQPQREREVVAFQFQYGVTVENVPTNAVPAGWPGGVRIAAAAAGSTARAIQLGFRTNDVIVALNGGAVTNAAHLARMCKALNGATATVGVVRAGSPMDIVVPAAASADAPK